jgi:phosphoribosylaminoimidazole-succinocarboxamide synthase
MNPTTGPSQTDPTNPIASYRRTHQGKVRDSHDISGNRRLIVATDRVSAFDVVLEQEIIGKGQCLTQMTINWLNLMTKAGLLKPPQASLEADGLYHHFETSDLSDIGLTAAEIAAVSGRAMVVRKADYVLPIECIVRGYLAGSGYESYRKDGTVCGYKLPAGLQKASALPRLIFTPSTKAVPPDHDENISVVQAAQHLTKFFWENEIDLNPIDVAHEVEMTSLALFSWASEYARIRGIVIADTKAEFGLIFADGQWQLMLIDEILTPDSSRYWEESTIVLGQDPPSLDKQPLRIWLQNECDAGRWNKKAPAPAVDQAVLDEMAPGYWEINRRLFG